MSVNDLVLEFNGMSDNVTTIVITKEEAMFKYNYYYIVIVIMWKQDKLLWYQRLHSVKKY